MTPSDFYADGSIDYGFGVVLRPTCQGIRVEIDGRLRTYITADELRPVLAAAVTFSAARQTAASIPKQ